MNKNTNTEEFRKYDELQKIISAVDEVMENTALLDNIKSEAELERVMPVLLASLGKYAQADRSYIFELKPGCTDVLHMTHIWCAPGMSPTDSEMHDIALSDVPNWYALLHKAGRLVSCDCESDKNNWPKEYALFSGQGVHSVILFPLVSAGAVIGYMGIDNPDRSRVELTVSLLKGISGHISGLKENLHMMQKLEENQCSLEQSLLELNKEKNILDALSVDYTSIYYCDLIEDTFIPVKCEEYNNAAAAVKNMAEQNGSYAATIRQYYEQFVIKESAPDFLEKLDAQHLMEHLRRNKRFAYKYRVHPNKAGQQYFEIQIVRLPETDGFKVIMGYRYIDDLVAEQEKLQTKLENALAEVTLNSEIVGSISKLYWLIYHVDLVEKTYEEVSAADVTHKLTGRKGYIADILQGLFDKIVSDEYRPIMEKFWDISTLSERLRDTDTVATEYKTRSGSWNLAKTDFLRRMSHDIRTPINGIQGMVTIAEHFPNDLHKQQECREKVKEASSFLLDLVNSILDMNKLESGAIELEHKPFDLLDALQEANSIAKMNADPKNLTVTIDHAKIRHRRLLGSPLHLKQILQNVAGNAVKYNKENGSIAFSTTEIACANNMATYRFVCSDTGRGMSPAFLAHAFEPFAQEDTSARTSYMGTGLGLPIAKQLAEMMGGTIEIQSEQNVGTTVIVTIPFALDTVREADSAADSAEPKGSIAGTKVLLVEDNELNMEIAKFILADNGMEVTTAVNGKQAVDLFAAAPENGFDLVLMDIMMPVMDGLTATRMIRALPRKDAQQVPIFAMTANAFSDDIAESRKAGMNEHLSKPLDPGTLLRVIRRYIAH